MLTHEEIANLKPKAYTYRVTEKGDTPGFGVAVDRSGNKSFFVQYRDDTHRVKYRRIASVDELSVEAARKQCAAFRQSLREHQPVQAEQQLIAELVRDYLERLQRENRNWKRATRALARAELFPLYEKMVSEVDSLEPWLAFMDDRPYAKQQVMAYLRAATGIDV